MSQELRLIRRITLKLIPFLILLYLIAYGSAPGCRLRQAAHGRRHRYWRRGVRPGAGLFFIGAFRWNPQQPEARTLRRAPLVCADHGHLGRHHHRHGLLFRGRTFLLCDALSALGAAEAGFFRAFCTTSRSGSRFAIAAAILGLFILSQPIAMLITGPVSGGLLGMDGILGLHGWQWLFIVIGSPAILLTWPVLRWLAGCNR